MKEFGACCLFLELLVLELIYSRWMKHVGPRSLLPKALIFLFFSFFQNLKYLTETWVFFSRWVMTQRSRCRC